MIRGILIAFGLMMLGGLATAQQAAERGNGAILRGLDKRNGAVQDLEVAGGSAVQMGYLDIALRECRYPPGNRSGDAWAFVVIKDSRDDKTLFSGWMVASSPALNAFDHPRFDVWALRCTT